MSQVQNKLQIKFPQECKFEVYEILWSLSSLWNLVKNVLNMFIIICIIITWYSRFKIYHKNDYGLKSRSSYTWISLLFKGKPNKYMCVYSHGKTNRANIEMQK